jgi:hypothetical protein
MREFNDNVRQSIGINKYIAKNIYIYIHLADPGEEWLLNPRFSV